MQGFNRINKQMLYLLLELVRNFILFACHVENAYGMKMVMIEGVSNTAVLNSNIVSILSLVTQKYTDMFLYKIRQC